MARMIARMGEGLTQLAARRSSPWIFVMLLGLVLRLPGLVSRPLWYDEAFAVLFSGKGLPAMLEGTLRAEAGVAADVHPLLYYGLLSAWQSLLGSSVLAVRSLSLAIGLLLVGLGYGLARRSMGPNAGFAAGVALAASPFQVHYAQEVRMYGLLAVTLMGATWALWEARSGAGWKAWVLFAVFSAAGQYSHNLAVFYLIPLASMPWAEKKWGMGIRTAAAGLLTLSLYLPWLLYLPSQVARLRWAYWIERPGPAELVRTAITFLADRPVPTWPPWGISLALFCSLLVFLILGRCLVRAGAESAPRWYVALALAPIGLLYLASLLQPVYLDRALLPSAAILCLALGWLVTTGKAPMPMRAIAAAALGITTIQGLAGFYTYRGFPHAPFEELVTRLRSDWEPGEVIVHSNKISALPSAYYGPDLDLHYLADSPESPNDTLARPTQEVLGLLADADIVAAVGDSDGVWFIQFRQEVEDYVALGIQIPPALAWLEQNFGLAAQFAVGDLQVFHFEARAPRG